MTKKTNTITDTCNNNTRSPFKQAANISLFKGSLLLSTVLYAFALGCCSQGLEFMLADANAKYPEDYPAEGSEILLTGTWNPYKDPKTGEDFYALTASRYSLYNG